MKPYFGQHLLVVCTFSNREQHFAYEVLAKVVSMIIFVDYFDLLAFASTTHSNLDHFPPLPYIRPYYRVGLV